MTCPCIPGNLHKFCMENYDSTNVHLFVCPSFLCVCSQGWLQGPLSKGKWSFNNGEYLFTWTLYSGKYLTNTTLDPAWIRRKTWGYTVVFRISILNICFVLFFSSNFSVKWNRQRKSEGLRVNYICISPHIDFHCSKVVHSPLESTVSYFHSSKIVAFLSLCWHFHWWGTKQKWTE